MAPSNCLRSAAGTIASPLPDPVVSIVIRNSILVRVDACAVSAESVLLRNAVPREVDPAVIGKVGNPFEGAVRVEQLL